MRPHRIEQHSSRQPFSRAWSRLALVLAGLSLAALAGAQVVEHPQLAVTGFQNRSTDQFVYFDQADGSGRIADRLRPPTTLRVRGLSQNLYAAIGRASTQPTYGDLHLAPIHEANGSVRSAAFVEASTGYMAYLEDIGKGGDLGTLKPLIGRPFGSINAEDGNFALLPRRDATGRTRGLYLIHATTGKGLYVDDVQDLRLDPPVASTTDVPPALGWVSSAPIQRSEQTTGYLLIDNAGGTLTQLDITNGAPERLVARTLSLDLNQTFAADAYNPSPTRFVLVPLIDNDQTSIAHLLIDVSTGKLAVLEDLGTSQPRLRILAPNLYQELRPGLGETTRVLTAVPNHGTGGRTEGIWLIDSLGRSIVYLANLDDPARLTLETARIER